MTARQASPLTYADVIRPPRWMKPVAALSHAALDVEPVWLEEDHNRYPIPGIDPDQFIPIYRWVYPLPSCRLAPYDINDMLAETWSNTCAISVDKGGPLFNEVQLGLTGCGMDMSWDICFGHMVAGYLPPWRFCRLPFEMTSTLKTRWIAEGCIKTSRLTNQPGWARESIRSMLKKRSTTRKGALRPGRF